MTTSSSLLSLNPLTMPQAGRLVRAGTEIEACMRRAWRANCAIARGEREPLFKTVPAEQIASEFPFEV